MGRFRGNKVRIPHELIPCIPRHRETTVSSTCKSTRLTHLMIKNYEFFYDGGISLTVHHLLSEYPSFEVEQEILRLGA